MLVRIVAFLSVPETLMNVPPSSATVTHLHFCSTYITIFHARIHELEINISSYADDDNKCGVGGVVLQKKM